MWRGNGKYEYAVDTYISLNNFIVCHKKVNITNNIVHYIYIHLDKLYIKTKHILLLQEKYFSLLIQKLMITTTKKHV